jgi:Necrosis inducing protein (NPP1)
MAILARLFQLLALSAAVNGTPLQRRGTLPPDQIKGLAEAVPSDNTGTLYEAYQPYLDVINGCVPFPAVDINGNTKYNISLPELIIY